MLITEDKPDIAQRRTLDAAFDHFDDLVRKSAAVPKDTVLFTTSVDNLFDDYLAGFATDVERQYHNCSCCRHFINRFGSLVTIQAGVVKPFAFNLDIADVPALFRESFQRMHKRLLQSRVTGIFQSRDAVLGTQRTGEWTHLWAANPARWTDRIKTPGQKMAESREEFGMLNRAMQEFKANVFERAVTLLTTSANVTTNKFKRHAEGLQDLAEKYAAAPNQRARDLLLWETVATAGPGFTHVRSSSLGTLLADLNNGVDDQAAIKAFEKMVDPYNYMRATTAPKAGNIRQAEDLVAKLGLAPAFPRRYVALSEVANNCQLWWPAAGAKGGVLSPDRAEKAVPGVFAALTQKAGSQVQLMGTKAAMTWEKFAKTILLRATHIELVPAIENTYGALTTAVDPNAPPLFAWDDEGDRNPFSWYRWAATESASFGVNGNTQVLGIIPLPEGWKRTASHPGVILVLDGAADQRAAQAGLGLYGDLLKPDLRPVRATILAHSMQGRLASVDGQLAAGLVLRKGATSAVLRVTTGQTAMDYAITAWE